MHKFELNWKSGDSRCCLSRAEAEAIAAGYFSFVALYSHLLPHLELVSIEPDLVEETGRPKRILNFKVVFVDPFRAVNAPAVRVERTSWRRMLTEKGITDWVSGELSELVYALLNDRRNSAIENNRALDKLL